MGAISGAKAGVQYKAVGPDKKVSKTVLHKGEQVTNKIDFMRFTHAWLRYVLEQKNPGDAVERVMAAFGGREGCESLYKQLIGM